MSAIDQFKLRTDFLEIVKEKGGECVKLHLPFE